MSDIRLAGYGDGGRKKSGRTDSRQASEGASSKVAIAIMSSVGSQSRSDMGVVIGESVSKVDIVYVLAFVTIW